MRIGEDSAERVAVIPPQIQVIRTVRPKYACHHCEGSGDEERPAVRVAPAPPALIPKELASEGLLAFISRLSGNRAARLALDAAQDGDG